jgi:hypothetical protein
MPGIKVLSFSLSLLHTHTFASKRPENESRDTSGIKVPDAPSINRHQPISLQKKGEKKTENQGFWCSCH